VFFGSLIGAGFVRNNVLIGNTSGTTSLSTGGTTAANNKTSGTLTAEYRLTSADLAVGTIGVDIASTDYDGDTRVGGSADKGAYEYP